MRAELDRGGIAALSGGHGAVDFASGAVPAMLPFLAERFDLSYTLTALLMLSATISSSLVQPLFGLLSDRRGAMWLLPAVFSSRARDRVRRGGAELRARAGRGVRRGARHRRLPPGGSEVRVVCERPAARERHVPVQRRRKHRLRARPDHHHTDRGVARAQRNARCGAAGAPRRGGDHPRAPLPARPRPDGGVAAVAGRTGRAPWPC